MKHCVNIGAVLALAAAAGAANGQAFFSELFVNPPGNDNGFEGIELTGTPGLSLDGYFFIVIEGDTGISGLSGIVDQVINLNGQSLGSNGLLLIRDSATVLTPAPDPQTSLMIIDFNPDVENGANTYILGFGEFPAVGTDLDLDNDGAIDAPVPGFTALDAVAYIDGFANTGLEYADDFGGESLGAQGPFTPDALYRVLDPSLSPHSWTGGDVAGTPPGAINFSATNSFGWQAVGVPDPSVRTLDLGTLNFIFEEECYPDCDISTGKGVLDIFDFLCFQNEFANSTPYACDCDIQTGPGVCDIFDFLCFQNEFAAGCP
jgi:hypothetical protein